MATVSSGSAAAPTCSGRGAGTSSTSGLRRAGAPAGWSGGDADGLTVDDLVEVLRQAEPDLAVAPPLGHALGDPGHERVAVRRLPAVPQRDERQHAALDLVVPVGGVGDGAHLLVVRVGAAPLGLDLGVIDGSVLAILEHHATDALATLARRDDRDDEAELLAEVGGEPAVPP